jgi:lipopolysaccharide transport system ATP-binding protein
MSSDVQISQTTIRNVRHSPSISADDIVISVRNVGKMYYLYERPLDRLKQAFLWGSKKLYREFWALRDVSFEVKRGETVGIIGRNGAGKSTLLQIIAGTLAPTTGEVVVNGRVAALLELGSGFNPEFTGRENVYLNGAIWGFSREEIDERFDEIAAFADIGQFIDQPVKLYSSGMFVRLAFAVQAFVSKEVLVVDEVLAVGDEAFQRKCMAVLEKFRDNGGTVLLVSHDTQTIVRQCERCLLLSHGELLVDGNSKAVTELYQKLIFSDHEKSAEILANLHQHGLQYAIRQSQEKTETELQIQETTHGGNVQSKRQVEPLDWFDPNLPKTSEVAYGNGDAEIIDYGIYNQQGERVNVLTVGQRYEWVYKVRFHRDAYNAHFGMMLKTVDGLDVAGISSDREGIPFDHIAAPSLAEVSFSIKLNVAPGTYFLNAGVVGIVNGKFTYLHRRVDVCMIRVLPCDSREVYGIAYLDPEFKHSFKQKGSQT